MADLVTKFTELTDCNSDVAVTYLVKYEWDFEEALHHYFEENGKEEEKHTNYVPVKQPHSILKSSKNEGKRIQTLDSLTKEENDDEKSQAYYAGGSEKSGQLILGPSSSKKDLKPFNLEDIFQNALSQGATQIDPNALAKALKGITHPGIGQEDDLFGNTSSKKKKTAFMGKGYVLGDEPSKNESLEDYTDTSSNNKISHSSSSVSPPRGEEITAVGISSGTSSNQTPHTTGTTPAGYLMLRMWQDGFTVNERGLECLEHRRSIGHDNRPMGGENDNSDDDEDMDDISDIKLSDLRPYTNPENQRFLNAVMRGEIPDDLAGTIRSRHLNLIIEDHRSTTLAERLDHSRSNRDRSVRFAPVNRRTLDTSNPSPQVRAFTGQGYMLGSPSPNVVKSTNEPGTTTASNGQPPEGILKSNFPTKNSNSSDTTPPAHHLPTDFTIDNFDPALPETTIQIRLENGAKMSLKCNTRNTIEEIRLAIVKHFPKYEINPFKLLITFPRKELEDLNETIEGANLQNSVIVQRIIT